MGPASARPQGESLSQLFAPMWRPPSFFFKDDGGPYLCVTQSRLAVVELVQEPRTSADSTEMLQGVLARLGQVVADSVGQSRHRRVPPS